MRHFVQFLVPVLIVFVVAYLSTRRQRQAVVEGESNDTGKFILIVVIGSIAAVGVMFSLGNYLEF